MQKCRCRKGPSHKTWAHSHILATECGDNAVVAETPHQSLLNRLDIADRAIQATAMAVGMGKKTPTKTPRRAPTHTCAFPDIFSINRVCSADSFVGGRQRKENIVMTVQLDDCPRSGPFCKAFDSHNDITAVSPLQQQNGCMGQLQMWKTNSTACVPVLACDPAPLSA